MKSHDASVDTAQRQPAAAPRERTPVSVGYSEGAVQLNALQTYVDRSPHMMVQRRAIDAAFGNAVQRQADGLEDEGLLQARMDAAQAGPVSPQVETTSAQTESVETPLNLTGMPSQLKAGIESLSGMDMSDVRVHRNSDKPAQLNAFAYAQGNDIHLGPGQERHLPHEAWHVVQQQQGRVKATTQVANVGVNSDIGLEAEADSMGGLAVVQSAGMGLGKTQDLTQRQYMSQGPRTVAQRVPITRCDRLHGNGVAQRALVTDPDILGTKGTTYRWVDFRGTRTNNLDGSGTELGRGAALTTGKQNKTRVDWGPIDAASGEGSSMRATIGPDHNLGSTPSAPVAVARVAAFAKLSGKDYISGHMLNEKLGGPGNERRNLTAISGSANGLHASNIEKLVRDPVNERGAWMRYEVSVAYVDDNRAVNGSAPEFAQVGWTIGCKLLAHPTLPPPNAVLAVRYARELRATWAQVDEDNADAEPAHSVIVQMESPIAGLSAGAATASGDTRSGAASGKAAVFTLIQPEELVLTKSDLLKHIVDSREPLSLRIKQLKENIAALEGTAADQAEASKAMAILLDQAGEQAGYNDAFNHELTQSHLSVQLPKLDSIDIDSFKAGYQRGLVKGSNEGKAFVQGYGAGYELGYNEDTKVYAIDVGIYKQGVDLGWETGYREGWFSQGTKISFERISLVGTKYEIPNNTPESFSSTTIELSGGKIKHKGAMWYEMYVSTTSDPRLQECRNERRTVWMNKRWMKKGA